MTCPLCRRPRSTPRTPGRDGRLYWRCRTCDLVHLDPGQRLTAALERARYDLHTHDDVDPGYLRFVAPLVDEIRATVPVGARGLDFGAGRVPTLARLLTERGLVTSVYDAFYWPEPAALERTYDFVVTCEVVEHLYDPAYEFAGLRARLAPGAPLFVMTELLHDEIDFDHWAYRRDPTHVAFYSAETFRWIADHFGFKKLKVTRRVISLFTPGG